MEKEIKKKQENNCIGCFHFTYTNKVGESFCYNDNSPKAGFMIEEGPSCELKSIRKP